MRNACAASFLYSLLILILLLVFLLSLPLLFTRRRNKTYPGKKIKQARLGQSPMDFPRATSAITGRPAAAKQQTKAATTTRRRRRGAGRGAEPRRSLTRCSPENRYRSPEGHRRLGEGMRE